MWLWFSFHPEGMLLGTFQALNYHHKYVEYCTDSEAQRKAVREISLQMWWMCTYVSTLGDKQNVSISKKQNRGRDTDGGAASK